MSAYKADRSVDLNALDLLISFIDTQFHHHDQRPVYSQNMVTLTC